MSSNRPAAPVAILLGVALFAMHTEVRAQPCWIWAVHGCDNVSVRGTLGTMGGEASNTRVNDNGTGHDTTGTGTRLDGFNHVLQDQNAATVEAYRLILRGDTAGVPDTSPGGLLLQTTPIAAPPGSGVTAWNLTVTFATPSTALPLCNAVYYGLDLPANANWPNDGHSLHAGTYGLLGGTQGDNPAPGAPNLAWLLPGGTGGTPVQPAPMCFHVGLLVQSAVLNMGNVDPTLSNPANCITAQNNTSFGAGGKWPRLGGGRVDGLVCRVRDGNATNGLFVTLFGNTIGCPGIPFPPVANGALYLNPTAIVQIGVGVLDATGEGVVSLLPPGAATSNLLQVPLSFQAFTLDPTFGLPGHLTNLATSTYLP